MVAFLMIAYIIDIISFLFSIFYTGKNTANICFSLCTWAKACRIRKKFFQELDRNNFLSIVLDWCCRKHSHILKTTHMIQIALSKSHKETNTFYARDCLCKRLYLLMVKKVHILLSDLIKIVLSLYFHWRNLHPMSVFPVASRCTYFTKIDFRIKVCRKCISMITAITVQNVNGINLIKFMFQCICTICLCDTWVKSASKQCCKTCIFKFFAVCPLPGIIKIC